MCVSDVPLSDVHSRAQLVTDGARVRQIVMNGLTNAIKYAAPAEHGFGPIRVTCGLSSPPRPTRPGDTASGGFVMIEVLDAGPGLRGQSEEALFADFASHVPATRTGAVGSSGLGLAICNRMARLLGGTMHLGDRGDGVSGTRFALSLPLEQPLAAAAAQPAPHAGEENSGARGRRERSSARLTSTGADAGYTVVTVATAPDDAAASPRASSSSTSARVAPEPSAPLGLHVLLVDDSAGNRRVGCRMLQQLGCRWTTASDGDEVRWCRAVWDDSHGDPPVVLKVTCV